MKGDIGIGHLIYQERHRDAIHIAVAPVVAAEDLKAGQHVAINDFGKAVGMDPFPGFTVGIVDPFLMVPVKAGDVFYVFLYPGTIESLRHEWEHPAFKKVAPIKTDPDKAASEKWLRDYARRFLHQLVDMHGEDAAYQTLLEDMKNGTITYHGVDMHSRGELVDPDELKHHTEVVLGIKIDYDKFEYFSCTC